VNSPGCDPPPESAWVVWRIDDNGNTFIVREHLSRDEANCVVVEFSARGHKQMYWAEREPDNGRG
jgi:hypothetical protein